jgi:hypothetical protein
MASQLLFGELVEILERKGRQWLKVRCIHDNFVAWADSNQITEITPNEFGLAIDHFAFSLELVQAAMGHNHFVPITIGARLPNFDGLNFRLGETQFTYSGQAVASSELKDNPQFLLKMAKRYLNSPFLWGGRSPFGIDSAGFIQVLFAMTGHQLPRDPAAQINSGAMIDFVEQAQAGDLAFFENKNGRIHHVGLIMEDQTIIHAYGSVRIDRIDHFGIYNETIKRYTHKLRICKRILPNSSTISQQVLPQKEIFDNQVELF